jgi:phosphoglycerol transferase MdoB-like AlkP superfamily enzyme
MVLPELLALVIIMDLRIILMKKIMMGIFDEPFLQFTAQTIKTFPQPFFSTIFTLTSHHPYYVPKHLERHFEEGSFPIHKSIRYADYALRKFFETVKNSEWFSNTLFVITADHTGPAEAPEFQTSLGIFAVPVLYYHKSLTPAKFDEPTQHTDILPSILDYLNFPYTFNSLGQSIFSDNKKIAYNFADGYQQVIDARHMLKFNGESSTELYDYKNDKLLKNNLISTIKASETAEFENTIKAVIQKYRSRMINNKLYEEKE